MAACPERLVNARSGSERRRGNRVGDRRASAIPRSRRLTGWTVAVAGLPLLSGVLSLPRQVDLSTVLLLYLALVVVVAALGGAAPAVAAAITAFLIANWFFTPPFHRFTIAQGEHLVALAVFLGVALVVSRFVDAAARQAVEAARARTDARTLAGLAATIEDDDPLPRLLDHLCSVFALDGAAVLRPHGEGWRLAGAAGDRPPADLTTADVVKELGDGAVLVLRGRPPAPSDHIVLNAFAARLAAGLDHAQLRAEAGRARALAEADALRSALLQAVSHDLRTPLAAIKASATSLDQSEVAWSAEQTADFVHTINEETDHLSTLVGNLLDMSRIQVGAVEPLLAPVALEEIVPAALLSLGVTGDQVVDEMPDTLPLVMADATLLERAIANVVQNAVRYAPPGEPVRVVGAAADGWLHLRVIDRGPGIAPAERERVFQPFQRSSDARPARPEAGGGAGAGLGLAVAKGFLTAMGGTISVEDTPGGGTTMVIGLPTVEAGE